MAITNGYISLADFKAGVDVTSSNKDAFISELIEACSRAIDDECGRRFWLSPTPETRYYTARLDDRYLSILTNPFLERKAWSRYPIDIMDCVSVQSVSTNESGDRTTYTTWTAGQDYYLEPINGAADFIPYNRIRADPINGRYWFPPWPQGVKVVGTWGYAFDYDGTGTPQAPSPIREACRLMTNRLYKRAAAPFGTPKAGMLESGFVSKLGIKVQVDDDIKALLAPYRYNVGEQSKNWVLI